MTLKIDALRPTSSTPFELSSHLLEMDQTRSRAQEALKSHSPMGLFSLKDLCKRFLDPILVTALSDIHHKLLSAIACEKFDGLGQDLVAMCANDLVAKGAEPLFFVDHFSCGDLRATPFLRVINGIVAACDEINCALIDGKTKEAPLFYQEKHFSIVGYGVGVMEKSRIITPTAINENDIVLGLSSSGLHTSGLSLAHKIIFDHLHHKANDVLWQTESGVSTVADELLRPTKQYTNCIAKLTNKISINALAHVAHGGIWDNISKLMPRGLSAALDLSAVDIPPIFAYLMTNGFLSKEIMMRNFNMGIGMLLIISPKQREMAEDLLRTLGEKAWVIGSIKQSANEEKCAVDLNSF